MSSAPIYSPAPISFVPCNRQQAPKTTTVCLFMWHWLGLPCWNIDARCIHTPQVCSWCVWDTATDMDQTNGFWMWRQYFRSSLHDSTASCFTNLKLFFLFKAANNWTLDGINKIRNIQSRNRFLVSGQNFVRGSEPLKSFAVIIRTNGCLERLKKYKS